MTKDLFMDCYLKMSDSSAGASLEHTHSQLIVTPIVPQLVENEMANAKTFYQTQRKDVSFVT